MNRLRSVARVHWPVLMPLALLIIVFRGWFHPGLIQGGDFPPQPFAKPFFASSFPWPNAWFEGFQFGLPLTAWFNCFPIWSIGALLATHGASWGLIERVLWLFPYLIIAPLSAYVVGYRLTTSPAAAACGAAVTTLNTWSIGLFMRGHIPSLDAFAFMPLTFYVTFLMTRCPTFQLAITLALLLTAESLYDVRYAFMSVLICIFALAVRLLWRRPLAALRIGWAPAIACGAAFIGLNLYWLLPAVFGSYPMADQYTTVAAFNGSSSYASIQSTLAFLFEFYHYVNATNPFAADRAEPLMYLVPALFFVGMSFKWRHPVVKLVLALWCFSVVFASGATGVFADVNRFMFVHVPGLKLYRDSSKFYAVLSICLGLGVALAVVRLLAWVRSFEPSRRRAAAALAVVAPIVAGIAYAGIMIDAFNPGRAANFLATPPPLDDRHLQAFLDAQPGRFRTLTFPNSHVLLDARPEHPLIIGAWFDTIGTPYGFSDLSQHPEDALRAFEDPANLALLHQTQTRYVVVMNDPRHVYYRRFQFNMDPREIVARFDRIPWLKRIRRFGDIVVYRVLGRPAPSVYAPRYPALVLGTGTVLPALAGTRYWNGRAGLVFLRDLPAAEPALARIPTIIMGSEPVDSDGVGGDREALEISDRLADGWFAVKHGGARRVGLAVSRYSAPDAQGSADGSDAFAQTFFLPHGTRATVHAAFATRAEGPVIKVLRVVEAGSRRATIRGGRADVPLVRAAGIPLIETPVVALQGAAMAAIAGCADAELAFAMRERGSGRRSVVTQAVAGLRPQNEIDVRAAVSDRFEEEFQRLIAARRNDFGWMRRHQYASPRTIGDEILEDVDLRLPRVCLARGPARRSGADAVRVVVTVQHDLEQAASRLRSWTDAVTPSAGALERRPEFRLRRLVATPSAEIVTGEDRGGRGDGRVLIALRYPLPQGRSVRRLRFSAKAPPGYSVRVDVLESGRGAGRRPEWRTALPAADWQSARALLVARSRTPPMVIDVAALRAADELPPGYGFRKTRSPVTHDAVYLGVDPETFDTAYVGPDHRFYRYDQPGQLPPRAARPSFRFDPYRQREMDSVPAAYPVVRPPVSGDDPDVSAYDVDLLSDELAASPAARRATAFRVSLVRDVGAAPPPSTTAPITFAIAHVRISGVAPASRLRLPKATAVALDDRAVAARQAHRDAFGVRIVATSSAVTLARGPHRLRLSPGDGYRLEGAALLPPPPAAASLRISQLRRYSPSLFSVHADGDGLLVVATGFDHGWKLASFTGDGPSLSGDVFSDFRRLRSHTVDEATHLPINTVLNGWITKGSRRTLVLYYLPEYYVRLGAALSLAVAALLIGASVTVWVVRRALPRRAALGLRRRPTA